MALSDYPQGPGYGHAYCDSSTIEVCRPTESFDFTDITVTVKAESGGDHNDGYIRIKSIDSGITSEVLLPIQDTWIF